MIKKNLLFFRPSQYQSNVDWQSKIKKCDSVSDSSKVELDILFVGGGPAGLSGAIKLKQLSQEIFPDIQIGVIEKANQIGGHSLSGAVINPIAFQELFPEMREKQWPFQQKVQNEKLYYLTQKKKWPLPIPPTMKNKNFYTASLCEVVRWMAEKAENMGIHIFTSFTADCLLVDGEQVKGIRTFPNGLNKDRSKSPNYQEPMAIHSRLTVLSEGSRGHLSQAWMHWKKIGSRYPQTYALGVKELWSVPSLSSTKTIIHTMGWPLPNNCFGGSWIYPLKENLLSLGLVAGLDSPFKNLDVHLKLQELKNHPLFYELIKGGKCVEWGAKTIPEGGYHSMPAQMHDHGLLICGDSAQMVNVPALKGIHYAMTSGMLAAETAFSALKTKDFSSHVLKNYDHKVRKKSRIGKELYPIRNVRQAFQKNIFYGLFQAGLMFLTKGIFPNDKKEEQETDAEKIRTQKLAYSSQKNEKSLGKENAVYLSGNKTRDDIPVHVKEKDSLPEEIQDFYIHLCPAGVYEKKEKKWHINAPNCIDCKATDIVGPRWNPKEGGTGPNYKRM